jgi:hypothetical protein
MSIRVSVTQEDLDKGVPNRANACALFRALARRVPWASDIRIFGGVILFNNRTARKAYVYETPGVVIRALEAFDNPAARKQLKPFQFQLQLPATRPMQTFKKSSAMGRAGHPKKKRRAGCRVDRLKRSYGHRIAVDPHKKKAVA